MDSYPSRLHRAIRDRQTPALVGLDPRLDQLPGPLIDGVRRRCSQDGPAFVAAAFEEFCLRLIDVVSPLVPAVKPQSAFFEALGPPGAVALARVMRRARDAGLIVICDAKRGDIGSTAEAYARGYLAGDDPEAAAWPADALTVNPYLGPDTLEPFVRTAVERGAGLYVLVRTSNPGAGAFQDRLTAGRSVCQAVAEAVEQLSRAQAGEEPFGPVGAVVGATWPNELADLRERMPHCPLLVPGYGSQGGGARDVAAAFNGEGLGAVVNSSRAINFAHSREPYASRFSPSQWESAVEAATRDMIDALADNTPAGRLRHNADS